MQSFALKFFNKQNPEEVTFFHVSCTLKTFKILIKRNYANAHIHMCPEKGSCRISSVKLSGFHGLIYTIV